MKLTTREIWSKATTGKKAPKLPTDCDVVGGEYEACGDTDEYMLKVTPEQAFDCLIMCADYADGLRPACPACGDHVCFVGDDTPMNPFASSDSTCNLRNSADSDDDLDLIAWCGCDHPNGCGQWQAWYCEVLPSKP
jgi:hypothetical protein